MIAPVSNNLPVKNVHQIIFVLQNILQSFHLVAQKTLHQIEEEQKWSNLVLVVLLCILIV